MITIARSDGRKSHIVQTVADLPNLSAARQAYMDVETTLMGVTHRRVATNANGKPKKHDGAFYPHLGHRACGLAVTVDDSNEAWYIPVRHHDKRWNLPLGSYQRWLQTLNADAEWINASVKLDAHVMEKDGYVHHGRFTDTTCASKLHDSDRWSHRLKDLFVDYLERPAEERDKVGAWLKGAKTNDYGACPADIMGEYACQDVFGDRDVQDWLDERRPAEMSQLWAMERDMTRVLYDMECRGMRIDRELVLRQKHECLINVITMQERISVLTRREYTDSSKCNFDILCNQLDLPPLAWSEITGAPSFDEKALAQYTVHPSVTANPVAAELVALILKNREERHYMSLFLDAMLDFSDANGIVHPSYNQIVRTGRTSAKRPNPQQMNQRAKALIIPPEGMSILRADASQVEFRMIVHYIRDSEAIEAYRNDPNTDFHRWVANQLEIKRKAAKNVNFATAFGAGKNKVMDMLANDPTVIEMVGDSINRMIESGKFTLDRRSAEYKRRCSELASRIYRSYHARFPGIKQISRLATLRCKRRGYVFNEYGRRRHMPKRAAHNAFNAIIQGVAMDFIKTRMVAVHRNFEELRMMACVHDELAWYVPTALLANKPRLREINECLKEQKPVKFRVPLTWTFGSSDVNWREAAGDDTVYNDSGHRIAGPLEIAA